MCEPASFPPDYRSVRTFPITCVEEAIVVTRFCKSSSGATSIEYCLIAGFLSILVVTGATSLGLKLNLKMFPIVGALN